MEMQKSRPQGKNHALHCKNYEKTRKGLLMRTYRNMKSRVLGIQKKKAHLYKGLPILDKEIFYKWSLDDESYNKLFDAWIQSKYDRRKTPSIDRIDASKGYLEDNIRWITHSQNSRETRQYLQQMSISI